MITPVHISPTWKHVAMLTYRPMHREGWLGAWDAAKSAWTKMPRNNIVQPITLEAWVKPNGDWVFDQNAIDQTKYYLDGVVVK